MFMLSKERFKRRIQDTALMLVETHKHTRTHVQAHTEANLHASDWQLTCGSGYWLSPSERISFNRQHLPLSPVLGVIGVPEELFAPVPNKQSFRARFAYRRLYTITS